MRHADFPTGPLVEVRLSRCLLVLGEAELIDLLRRDPVLWQQALQRGKALGRARMAQERAKGGAPSKDTPDPSPPPHRPT